MAMIFQDPMSTLNPVFTVGEQITKAIEKNVGLRGKAAHAKAAEMIGTVKLSDAESVMAKYKHERSGGQRQRIIIAIALACGAQLLIADEPTHNLDVTIQAGILKLLAQLQKTLGVTVLFIANNLSLITVTCDEVGLLYKGRIVERGNVRDVLRDPKHPYTRNLLQPLPVTDEEKERVRHTLAEDLPMTQGCPYQHKCPECMEICRQKVPVAARLDGGHGVGCHLYAEGGAELWAKHCSR